MAVKVRKYTSEEKNPSNFMSGKRLKKDEQRQVGEYLVSRDGSRVVVEKLGTSERSSQTFPSPLEAFRFFCMQISALQKLEQAQGDIPPVEAVVHPDEVWAFKP